MNTLISKVICIGFIATMLATPCLATSKSVLTQTYKSAAEMAKAGVYNENMLRSIYDNSTISRSTQYEESGNNISFSSADEIQMEEEAGQESHMFGYLSSSNTADYYEITPPRHGRVYVVLVSPSGYSYETTVYDKYQNEITCDTVPSTMKSFMATNGSTSSGNLSNYYIKVTSSSNYSTNRYRLIVFYALNYQNLNCVYPTTSTLTQITSPVGYRTSPNVEYHPGVDIIDNIYDDVPKNNIYSICNAVVVRAYKQSSMGVFVQAVTDFEDNSNYDDILDPYTNTPYIIRYMHMEDRTLGVSEVTSNGTQEIAKGQILGIMGDTGYSTGIHLHIDINNGNYLYSSDINNDLQSLINPLDLYDMTYTGDPY